MIDYENEAAEVRARINLLLKEKGITQNAVAAGDAPAQKRLNSQLSHGAAISLDSVLRVLNACPDVSAAAVTKRLANYIKVLPGIMRATAGLTTP